ncbi:hypothetical protein Q3C01_30800 [Bradyrhizobium sp. UFLA05-109]
MLNDYKSSDNASRTLAVFHFNGDICSGVTIVTADPPDDCSNLTQRMATRSFFVRKRTPFVVFDQFPILVLVKVKPGHLFQFPQKMVRLSQVRPVSLVIASQEFGISRQPTRPARARLLGSLRWIKSPR